MKKQYVIDNLSDLLVELAASYEHASQEFGCAYEHGNTDAANYFVGFMSGIDNARARIKTMIERMDIHDAIYPVKVE